MNYQEFVTEINKRINELLNPEATSQLHTTLKNNGTRRTGLTISQAATNISPTIYLEEYYHQYEMGWSLEKITENIAHVYHEVKFDHSWDVNQVQDFKIAKKTIAYKLINTMQNTQLLEDIPHINFFDLSIVFFILYEATETGSGTILITNDIMNHWNISKEVLYAIASENTPALLTANCKPMAVVIRELLGEEPIDSDCEDSHMYVLTNDYRHYGAACMLYPNVLEDISNVINEDFYILPSSIHEIIILPAGKLPDELELNKMIQDINASQVCKEDILSDHAYYYSRTTHQINML